MYARNLCTFVRLLGLPSRRVHVGGTLSMVNSPRAASRLSSLWCGRPGAQDHRNIVLAASNKLPFGQSERPSALYRSLTVQKTREEKLSTLPERIHYFKMAALYHWAWVSTGMTLTGVRNPRYHKN